MFDSLVNDITSWFNALPYIAVLFAVGSTGYFLRQSVETRKALQKIKTEFAKEGKGVNQKWHNLYNKANQKTWGVAISWIIVFGLVFYIIPRYLLIGLGVSVILILLGYFGLRIVPEGFGNLD